LKRLFALLAGVLLVHCSHAQTVFRAGPATSVIVNVCIPEINGEGFLHVDEDVSGLEIEVVNTSGVSVALYDAATEQEDVAAPGTGAWTVPSANNVRVGPDGRDLDCTELQFANGVFDDQEIRSLRISDGQLTIMDFNAPVVFLATSADFLADLDTGLAAYGPTGVATELNVNANETKIDAIDDYVDTEVATLLEALVGLGAEFTADSGTTTTIVDAALTQATNDWFLGQGVTFTSGTLAGQTACITGFTAASDTLTITAVTATVGTQTYYILPMAKCQTGDSFARIGTNGAGLSAVPWNASWDAEVQSEAADALDAENGLNFTSVPWNAAWDAEVQSEANDALEANELHMLLSSTYNPAAEPASDSLFGDLTESDGGVTRFNTNALELGPSGASAGLEQHSALDEAFLNCTVDTANFAGSTTTVACDLTDKDSMAVTVASGDLTGLELRVLSGAQMFEGRFINATTWDAANSELRLTLSRALPATLADSVIAIIR
jgi:hypothetical protein